MKDQLNKLIEKFKVTCAKIWRNLKPILKNKNISWQIWGYWTDYVLRISGKY